MLKCTLVWTDASIASFSHLHCSLSSSLHCSLQGFSIPRSYKPRDFSEIKHVSFTISLMHPKSMVMLHPFFCLLLTAKSKSTAGEVSRETPQECRNCTKAGVDRSFSSHKAKKCHYERVGRKNVDHRCHLLA